jgi:hypothetical protein
MNAEFFDIFGIFVFAIILVIGILIKFKRKKIPNNVFDWIAIILIIIGILGLIVDGAIVIVNYFVG